MTLPFNLPSPIHKVTEIRDVEIWLKRDDLIHPAVSGNKWRKLKFYWQAFEQSTANEMLSFGGAFSNHLAALAAAGAHYGVPTRALVRGEEHGGNPTLDYCRSKGMQLEFISRSRYREKEEPQFLQNLARNYPHSYIIPEGGKGPLGVKGCTQILEEVEYGFDWVCASAGTGTTMAGVMLSAYPAKFWAFAALKDQGFLQAEITANVEKWAGNYGLSTAQMQGQLANFAVQQNYHFGGYAKVTDELIQFMNTFFENTGVKLDPVYTGKMLYGLTELCQQGFFKPGTKILALHSGGLQGILGMNQKLKKQHKRTLVYEA